MKRYKIFLLLIGILYCHEHNKHSDNIQQEKHLDKLFELMWFFLPGLKSVKEKSCVVVLLGFDALFAESSHFNCVDIAQ